MTISDRRKEAARANGAKSRGPVTSEGKVRSSKNATKHGLFSQNGLLGQDSLLSETLVLNLESPGRFEALFAEFDAEHRPATITERALVAKLTAALWRQMRIWAMEKGALDRETERLSTTNDHETAAAQASLAFQSLGDSSRTLHLLHLYESRFERQFHRALRNLAQARLAQTTMNDADSKMKKRTQEVVENAQSRLENEPALGEITQ